METCLHSGLSLVYFAHLCGGGLYSREADFVLLRIINVRVPASGWLEKQWERKAIRRGVHYLLFIEHVHSAMVSGDIKMSLMKKGFITTALLRDALVAGLWWSSPIVTDFGHIVRGKACIALILPSSKQLGMSCHLVRSCSRFGCRSLVPGNKANS